MIMARTFTNRSFPRKRESSSLSLGPRFRGVERSVTQSRKPSPTLFDKRRGLSEGCRTGCNPFPTRKRRRCKLTINFAGISKQSG
jgi:hypothetical protein